MIPYLRFTTLVLLFFLLSLCTTAPVAANETLRFSTDSVQMKGMLSEKPWSARITLLTGAAKVENIKLFPSDLIDANGQRVPANGYQITPLSIATLDANSGELVTLSISDVPGAGSYEGTITVLYTGADPESPLTLAIQLVAEADPNAQLELEPNAAKIVIKETRRSFLQSSLTAATTFHLRQTANMSTSIVSIAPMRPAADGTLSIPTGALIVKPDLPWKLEPSVWQPITVQTDLALLPAGRYGGLLVISPEHGADQQVAIDLQVRDAWYWAFFVLFIGVGLSAVISYMTATGSARLTALRSIDSLRSQLDIGAMLPIEALERWRIILQKLDQASKTDSPEVVQPKITALETEIQEAVAVTEGYVKQIDDWREQQLDYWSGQNDEYVHALLESPYIRDLRARLAKIRTSLVKGGYDQGETRGAFAALTREMATLTEFVDALGAVHNSDKQEIQDRQPALADELKQVEGLHTPPFSDLITLFQQHGLIKKAESSQPPAAMVERGMVADEDRGATKATPVSTNQFKQAWVGFNTWLRKWLDPRKYLPVLSALLGGLFLVLLLAAGMEALYVNNTTFGANFFGDYLGVLLWGIGADASRKQLRNLEGATGYLQQRLGVGDGNGRSG